MNLDITFLNFSCTDKGGSLKIDFDFANDCSCDEIIKIVATPIIEPNVPSINEGDLITITCATDGVTIYYSTDGTEPNIVYSEPFVLTSDATVKAIARLEGWNDSKIAEHTYSVIPTPTVATPTITPNGGEINEGDLITITCATDGATIYYSTDGTEPSIVYSEPFALTSDATVKAIARLEGWNDSAVVEVQFTVKQEEIEYDIILEYNTANSSEMKFSVNNIEHTATSSPYYATLADVGVTSAEEITSYSFDTSIITKVVKLPFTSKIKSTENMFNQCPHLTEVNIDGWDFSGVENANFMFSYCYNLTDILNGGTQITEFPYFIPLSTWGMFAYCEKLTSIPYVDCSRSSNTNYMFANCEAVTSITLPKEMVYAITTDNMFQNCSRLETITSYESNNKIKFGANWRNGSLQNRWTSAQQMFYNCEKLKQIPFSNDTNYYYLQNISSMYYGCSALTNISFDGDEDYMSDLTNVESCFNGCSSLQTLDLSYWKGSTPNLTSLYNLFNGCSSLENVQFVEWDLASVDNYEGMFNGCNNLYSISLENASCATLNVIKETGFSGFINFEPSCGGNAQGSNRFILQATPNNMGYIEYNNSYSTSFNENYEEYFVYNESIENFEGSYGEVYALSFNNGIENIISIPYIDTLTSLTINDLSIKYLDLSITNLNNLEYLNISNLSNIVHLDLSNWETVSDAVKYNTLLESLDNLRTVKMLNCSQDAIDFIRQTLDNNGMGDVIIITEDNNYYITTDSSSSQSVATFGGSTQPLYSPVTDINDWGYSSFDGMSVSTLFDGNNDIYSVYNLPSLSATTGHWNMFFSCQYITSLDLSNWDFDWNNGDQDVGNMFYNNTSLIWVNLSNWDLTNAYNESYLFQGCGKLKWIFAYNCNDSTLEKLRTAINSSGYSSNMTLYTDNGIETFS